MKSGILALLLLFLLNSLSVVLSSPVPGRVRATLPTKRPAAGHSGIHHDAAKKIVHVHYGSKDMPEHMGHVQHNQALHPKNKGPFKVGPPGSKSNRKKALGGMKRVPGKARDEKPPNFVVHDGKSTTVKPVSKKESFKEMKLLGHAAKAARREGARVQFHANP